MFKANICLRLEVSFDGGSLNVFCLAVGSWVAVCRLHPHVRRSVAGLSPGLLLRRTGPGRDDPDRSRACTNGPRTGGGPPGSAGLECLAKNVVTVGLMRNDLSRVLTRPLGGEGYGFALCLVTQEGRHGVVEFCPPRGVVDRRDGSGAG
jgi:hypothetical protein